MPVAIAENTPALVNKVGDKLRTRDNDNSFS